MSYTRQVRRAAEDLEDELDLSETHHIVGASLWYDSITCEWVMDCLIYPDDKVAAEVNTLVPQIEKARRLLIP